MDFHSREYIIEHYLMGSNDILICVVNDAADQRLRHQAEYANPPPNLVSSLCLNNGAIEAS